MQAVMKFTKISPCLMASLLGLMAIVHRNTKLYMDASNSDCMPPSSAMAGSAGSMTTMAVSSGNEYNEG
jgi:hypothetical protein